MMRAAMPVLAAITVAASLAPTRAAACSVVAGYKVPTALQLVEAADTIVIATVERERRGAGAFDGTVLARPTTLLKGKAMPAEVAIVGVRILDDPAILVTRSDPRELRRPNPDALGGGCVRYLFRSGMRLVLFLAPDGKGGLAPYRSPFSRDAEDVVGDDAPWVRAVREYIAVAGAPIDEQRMRLAARSAALREADDSDSRAIADDLMIERDALNARARRASDAGYARGLSTPVPSD
jgi:hypothetical protein